MKDGDDILPSKKNGDDDDSLSDKSGASSDSVSDKIEAPNANASASAADGSGAREKLFTATDIKMQLKKVADDYLCKF